MGLNERRKIEELKTVTLPGRVKEIEDICGQGIPYDVDWPSFGDDGEALNFMDNISCHRLNMALRTICIDDMGKSAVRDGLKRIKLTNVKTKSEAAIQFTDGVSDMKCAYAMKLDGAFSDAQIREALMAKL